MSVITEAFDHRKQEKIRDLRDSIAMVALISSQVKWLDDERSYASIAAHCYKFADAMLEARNK